jgi:hypothetical protein
MYTNIILIRNTRPARFPAGLNRLQTEYSPLVTNHYYANCASEGNADCGGNHVHDNNRIGVDSNYRRTTRNTLRADSSHGRNILVQWKRKLEL